MYTQKYIRANGAAGWKIENPICRIHPFSIHCNRRINVSCCQKVSRVLFFPYFSILRAICLAVIAASARSGADFKCKTLPIIVVIIVFLALHFNLGLWVPVTFGCFGALLTFGIIF